MTNLYPRVIVDEFMPVITNQFNISPDPDIHAIAGSSPGAIAAFGVARCLAGSVSQSHQRLGSFVNLRGGYVYSDTGWRASANPSGCSFAMA